MSMYFRKLIFIVPFILLLSCGSDDSGDMQSDAIDETGVVNAVVLDYNIHVDNLPLVGPQSESLQLFIFRDRAKYQGTAEISIGDETQIIKRTTLFDFMNQEQILINTDDSSYKVISYNASAVTYEGEDSLRHIRIEPTDDFTEINGFSNCRKMRIIPYKSEYSGNADMVPVLKGDLWVKSDYANVSPILEYYKFQRIGMQSQDFIGMEIWRIFKQLGVPSEIIADILGAIDGLIVRGDFTCTLYSLGKKANVSINLSLTDATMKRISGEELRIPEEYIDKTESGNQIE